MILGFVRCMAAKPQLLLPTKKGTQGVPNNG
jgi:hypothetical protein